MSPNAIIGTSACSVLTNAITIRAAPIISKTKLPTFAVTLKSVRAIKIAKINPIKIYSSKSIFSNRSRSYK